MQFMPFIATSVLHFDHTKKDQCGIQRKLGIISKQLVVGGHGGPASGGWVRGTCLCWVGWVGAGGVGVVGGRGHVFATRLPPFHPSFM